MTVTRIHSKIVGRNSMVAKLSVGSDFSERVLRCFLLNQRPVFLGEISLDVGYGLDVCQREIDLLVDKGAVKKLSPEECQKIGKDKRANIYSLIDAAKFTLRPRSE